MHQDPGVGAALAGNQHSGEMPASAFGRMLGASATPGGLESA